MARSLFYASAITLLFAAIFPMGRIFRPHDSDTTKLLAVIRGGSTCYINTNPCCCGSSSGCCPACTACGASCNCACGLQTFVKQITPNYQYYTDTPFGQTGRTGLTCGSPVTATCLTRYFCGKCGKLSCGTLVCFAAKGCGVPAGQHHQWRVCGCTCN